MKKVFMLSLILVSTLNLSGQTMDKSELKEYFLDAEYFFAGEEYVDALYDYTELYNNGYSENTNINYRIGICYINIPGQKDKSIPFLSKATVNTTPKYKIGSFKETRAPIDAWLFLGNAYRINNQLDKAIEAYNKYKTLARSTDEIKYADQQIAATQIAINYMNNPLNIRKTNLGSPVNDNSSNYKAVVSGDGKSLVYMNELPFYDAVYFSKFVNNAWAEPVNITPQIQSDGDQYVSCLSYDGLTLYLTKEGNFDSDILVSKYENEKWSKSTPLGGNINTKYWESHASISRDGKTLYFTSNRKGGPGSMDIYKTVLEKTGLWSDPLPLSKKINTTLNEDTPFITDNDSLLFFSSQGHITMGGYDIQRSRLLASGEWSDPENLKYPINTTDDDLFYFPWHNGQVGYISLFEKNGLGKEDIYAIQPESEKAYYEFIADLLKEEIPVVSPEITAFQEEKHPEKILEQHEEYAGPNDSLQSQPVQPVDEKQPAEKPEPIKQPETMVKEVLLNPVYFDFDNFRLSETGEKELKLLAELLTAMPEYTLKLYGYADALGSAQYNLTLSEKRAISAMKYMVSLGIEAKRLSAVGLGETNFVAINTNPDGSDNPDGRKLNRRVEFEIVGIDAGKILIRRPIIPENLKYKSK
jgi:outer membrane protein OmpA-like peptidoglycan-associated protein